MAFGNVGRMRLMIVDWRLKNKEKFSLTASLKLRRTRRPDKTTGQDDPAPFERDLSVASTSGVQKSEDSTKQKEGDW